MANVRIVKQTLSHAVMVMSALSQKPQISPLTLMKRIVEIATNFAYTHHQRLCYPWGIDYE